MELGSILWAALGIGLLIFLHEAGHFLAARWAKVRVEVFSLGFGPRLCGFRWKETDFRLSLVPFGGYVMVAGQDPTDRRYPARESLYAKPVGKRALFWSAGVLMNTAFALVVFPLAFNAGVSFLAPVVGSVAVGSAAWEAGIQPGDRIVAVAGKAMYSFENLSVEVALHGNRPVTLLLRAGDGNERTVVVTPHLNREEGLYVLGIGPAAAPTPATLAVVANGPAARAGIQDGDLLLGVNGKPAVGADFTAAVRSVDPMTPTPVDLRVRRQDRELAVQVVPSPDPHPAPPRIGVAPLPRRVEGIRQGHPFLERLGLQRDDVVLAVDDRPFTSGDLAVARNGPAELRVHVLRDGAERLLQTPASAADREVFATHVHLTHDQSFMLRPAPGDPAALAGMLPGDRLESIDGQTVDDWDDLRKVVEGAGTRTLQIVVRRAAPGPAATFVDAASRELALPNAATLAIAPRAQTGYDLGLTFKHAELREEVRATSFGDALRLGVVCSLDLVKQLYVTLKRLLTGEVAAKNLGGIIRISQVSYDAAQRGASWFWYFLALLSMNLAFVNLLPIPVLDGGHLLFLLIEKVKGSPVSTRVLGYSQVVGLVFVLLLVLFVTYNDIVRLL